MTIKLTFLCMYAIILVGEYCHLYEKCQQSWHTFHSRNASASLNAEDIENLEIEPQKWVVAYMFADRKATSALNEQGAKGILRI